MASMAAIASPQRNTMNRNLKLSALMSAVLAGLLLTACAGPKMAPPELVQARSTLLSAGQDAAVLTHAPLELKKATDSLGRANRLLIDGEPEADVSSAAHVALQQARTALAIGQAKGNDVAIAGAELDRERARADIRTLEARRATERATSAQARATSAQAQTRDARQQATAADQRASGAEQQSALALASAADAQAQSAALQQKLTDLQAKQTERGMLVTLGDVLFETNKAEVKPAAQNSLRKLADFLQEFPKRQVLIEGHTDNVGSASYNEALSRRRADAVDTALSGMGVSTQRVDTAGYGEEFPITDNRSESNRALNRRVEVYIGEDDQQVKARR
jgi:outer membrane protein OmpA-like peptidoglycan-associated protein